jgi:hypothetical protein
MELFTFLIFPRQQLIQERNWSSDVFAGVHHCPGKRSSVIRRIKNKTSEQR